LREERKMPAAYVLVNTEIGAENQVIKELKKIEGVEEAHNLWGVYDIIAHVKAESMEKLKFTIAKRIEKVGRINSKLTMIIADNPQTVTQEQVIFESPIMI
jgi:DNA-binding Lrp family transcriptional regulator